MPAFETMILRFRDLSTSQGQTIERHRDIIRMYPKDPYTWWAWWNKIGEQVPSESFRHLNSEIDKRGSIEIFLFDTGTQSFYQARLTGIDWHINLTKKPSPEQIRTPLYYRRTEYLAWFKISEIVDLSPTAILKKWSYVRVDELFRSRRSIFSTFYDKLIVSAEELRHQEKAIWFIRKKRSSDSSTEILLYDTGKVFPTNFPENAISTKSVNLLWLSDLPFSAEHHNFPLKAEDSPHQKTLIDRLERELGLEGATSLAAVLISGDLTWQGSPEEYDLASSFIGELQSRFSLLQNQIIMCPGNHDLRFTTVPWEKDAQVEFAPDEAKENYVEFYKGIYGVQPNPYLCTGRRMVLGNALCVEIVSLNSSLLRQERGVFQGHGYIGEDQRDAVSKEMGWQSSPNSFPKPFRILMLHHHVAQLISETPTYESFPSVVFDAPELLKWIASYEVDLVLHGHMHFVTYAEQKVPNPNSENVIQQFYVVSMGSSGVKRSHIAENDYNTFSLLRFERSAVKVHTYKIKPEAQLPYKQRLAQTVEVLYR